MIAGFTGTRKGMTEAQRAMVIGLLFVRGVTEVHHGGCMGADTDFDNLVALYRPNISRHVHPSNLIDQQGTWNKPATVYPERDPLERNLNIVSVCQFLIACPGEYSEVIRSGTWATIRYARKLDKPRCIVFPDGILEEEL